MLLSINDLLTNDTTRRQINLAAKSINDCIYIEQARIKAETVIAAYALYKVRASGSPFSIDYQTLLNNDIGITSDLLLAIKYTLNENMWAQLSELLPKFAADIFAAVAFLPIENTRSEAPLSTPQSIVKLSQSILQCQSTDKIIDIGCGAGNFITETAKAEPKANFIGYDININAINITKIRAELLGINASIILEDAFSINETEYGNFDKAFSNYPFGMKLRNLGEGLSFIDSLDLDHFKLSKATSSDWIFNLLLSKLIKEDGKAIGIMTNNCTWNKFDTPIRQYFIENGLIEAVINLPSGIFDHTFIPTSLIVLSRDNSSVRLIDASNLGHSNRRTVEFDDNDIQIIIEALSHDNDYSKEITIEDLRENEYILHLTHYIKHEIRFDNGVPFETVIKRITRGAPSTAKQLDENLSKEKTDIQYLILSNIHDGKIDEDLPYLTKIDPKQEKYCLKNNDIILSKIGSPAKIAVASVPEGHKILASGNLFIIEIDQEKCNPYYIEAFFDSEQGTAALRSITSDGPVPNLSMDKLKKLEVPLPSLNIQNRIAMKYQAAMDEISILKLKLEKATDCLHHIYDEESGD